VSTAVLSTALLADIPNPADVIGDLIGGGASKIAEATFEAVMRRFAELLADAASKILTEVLHYLDASSSVSFDQGWFAGPRAREILLHVSGFAAVLVLLFVMVAIIQGLVQGDVGGMLRTVAVEVPMSVLSMAALTTVTGVLLAATDGVSSMVLSGAGQNLARALSFGNAGGIVKLGLFGYLLIPLFVLAAIAVWVELVVRSSLIYLLVAFAPVVLAVRVWPALRGAWHHLCRIGVALIVAKFAIALSLGLGAAALAGGGPADGDLGTEAGLTVGAVVVGASLMILAALSPFVILKLLPVFEAAVVAHGISRAPARAAQSAAQGAFYAQSIKRMASGHSGGGPGSTSASATAPGGGGSGGGANAATGPGVATTAGTAGPAAPGAATAAAGGGAAGGAGVGGAAGAGAAGAGAAGAGAAAAGPAAAVAVPVTLGSKAKSSAAQAGEVSTPGESS
jgi:type IV secretion system protein TrbL